MICDMFNHLSVLPVEVLESFKSLKNGSLILDGTLGKGGHSKLLLEKGFRVIGIDRDIDALNFAKENLKGYKDITFVHGNFKDIGNILKELKIEKVDGILLDLGLYTYQLEGQEVSLGFDGPLDMRVNKKTLITAETIVNEYTSEELETLLRDLGEKVFYKEITEAIIKERSKGRIKTGENLLKIIESSIPEHYRKTRKHHWATPTFRALRIAVNQDFENLETFLKEFQGHLNQGGILSIITVQTMEERIVKKQFSILKDKNSIKVITKKGITASNKELGVNPKSRIAMLWICQIK